MKIIKVGLKANASFLFQNMNGDTLGGTTGGILHSEIIHLNETQFLKFKQLIVKFGGNVEKSLSVSNNSEIDFSCYFVEN